MPRNFYSKIFDSFDREFQKKFKSLSSKYEKSPFTQKNTTKIKYDLSNLIGLKVLDCSTNSVIETESTITFAYILLNLALYPLDKKNMPLWNEHVKLFDEAERSNFNEYSVEKLHIFLTKNFFFEHEDFYSYVSIENLERSKRVSAKIRYSATESKATITPLENGNIMVKFDEKQRAITAGQSIVFYTKDILIGGGIIV